MTRSWINYWELTQELAKREIKQRYKQSVLGYAWVILNPFFQMVVMSFVFSKIVPSTTIGVPYPVFLFTALLPWTFFANSLIASVNSLVGNAGLLTKVYFPREIFVISALMAKVIDFALAITVFIGLMIWYQVPVGWTVLWVIPILLIQILFTYGISLIAACANLFYRDIQYLMNLIILLWFYMTPVLYPVEMFPPQYRWVFQINPMAVIVNAYREVILSQGSPNLVSLAIALALSVLLTLIGYTMFKKLEGTFADIV